VSAEITYSSSVNAVPSQTRAYRSSTVVALAAKSGSLMKIHDWCCHGLIASSASHRPTAEEHADEQIPSTTACQASSGQLHQDSGTPPGLGRLAGQRLDAGDLYRVEPRRTPGAFRVAQRAHAWLGTPSVAPLARRVHVDCDPSRDHRVRQALLGQQHDPGPAHQLLSTGAGPDQSLKFLSFGTGQLHHVQAEDRHQRVPFTEDPMDTSASPVTRPMLVSNTPIGHDEPMPSPPPSTKTSL